MKEGKNLNEVNYREECTQLEAQMKELSAHMKKLNKQQRALTDNVSYYESEIEKKRLDILRYNKELLEYETNKKKIEKEEESKVNFFINLL